MTVQDIKRGHYKKIEGNGLKQLIREHFGEEANEGGDGDLEVRYGALQPLRLRVLSKAELLVETHSDLDVPSEVAADTIRRFNRFLEAATGFNSKQRSKRLQKKAKEGKL